MDGDTEPKVDDLDNGWALDSEQTGEEEGSEIALELWQPCSVIRPNVIILFSCPTQTLCIKAAALLIGQGEATQSE